MPARNTRQRSAIERSISEAGRPLSIEEVLEAARRIVPTINLATVYRNVNRMVAERQINSVALPGQPPRFEIRFATSGHRHHFRCDDCDRVFDVEGCPGGLDGLVPPNFEMTGHDIILYGKCDECTELDGASSDEKPNGQNPNSEPSRHNDCPHSD